MRLQLEELPLDELNLVDCMYFFMNISNLAYNPGPRLAQRFTVRRSARVRALCASASWQLLPYNLGPRLAHRCVVRLCTFPLRA